MSHSADKDGLEARAVPAIEIRDLSFSYEGVPVLENVNLVLEQGDFLAILGPNGGGKSTLLKLMLGLLRPDRGTIRILGEAPHTARHRVGYVPQHVEFNRGFPISVMEVALMGRLDPSRMGRPYTREDRGRVARILKQVGMWEHRFAHVDALSGGQRQRVFIARALATEPEVLFLDEPTAGVDPNFEVGLYDLLKEWNKQATVVVVTHDIGVVSRYVRSVACVNRTLVFHQEGKITAQMMDMAYACPVDLVAHGLPHRVYPVHDKEAGR